MTRNGISRRGGSFKTDKRVLSDSIASDCPTPQDCAEVDCLKQDIRLGLEGLSEHERDVLLLRFGLDDGTPTTVEEVATRLRISKERVRLVEARALNKLRHPGRNYKLKEYIDAVEMDVDVHDGSTSLDYSAFGNLDSRRNFL